VGKKECIYQIADDSGGLSLCDVGKYTDNNTAAGYRLSGGRPGFYLQAYTLQAYTSEDQARRHTGHPLRNTSLANHTISFESSA
jgi:hypothetical protein